MEYVSIKQEREDFDRIADEFFALHFSNQERERQGDVACLTQLMINDLLWLVARGRVPASVPSLHEVHEYTDGNMLGGIADWWPIEHFHNDHFIALSDRAFDRLNHWIIDGNLRNHGPKNGK